jgi:DNA-binding NtrC family response regulator
MAGKHVLLVDDDASVRTLVSYILTHFGHSCEALPGAEEALAVLETANFQSVITDWRLQGMDGDAFAEEVKRRRPGMPVLLITGNKLPTVPGAVDGVLLKPFSITQLEDAIAALPTS